MNDTIEMPTTQRAYTLRLFRAPGKCASCGKDDCNCWRDALWATHEAINEGAKVFGDWLLTLRGGLDHNLVDAPVKEKRGASRAPTDPRPIGRGPIEGIGSGHALWEIAVALAIGRFAAGQARPLESVIIDEGFGSLDRDGLRCAAAELNRLRNHLRHIILVSHQEDFADRVPVVIRLAKGENGTRAIAQRK